MLTSPLSRLRYLLVAATCTSHALTTFATRSALAGMHSPPLAMPPLSRLLSLSTRLLIGSLLACDPTRRGRHSRSSGAAPPSDANTPNARTL